jgi:uncharacterized membrane protein
VSTFTREVHDLVQRIADDPVLDAPANAIATASAPLVRSPVLRRVLSGELLGHRLHPTLTDVPIGCWTSAWMLDMVAWRSGERAATTLTGIGVLGAIPTIAAGLSDWHETAGGARRIGVVHIVSNTIAVWFETASWLARRRGHHARGALYGWAGIGAATVGGYLGGHLVFRRGVGVEANVSDSR